MTNQGDNKACLDAANYQGQCDTNPFAHEDELMNSSEMTKFRHGLATVRDPGRWMIRF